VVSACREGRTWGPWLRIVSTKIPNCGKGRQTASTAATSSASIGSATASGTCRWLEASAAWVARVLASRYGYGYGYDDTATGLYHFGARYYNPTTGRFTQQDSLNTPLNPTTGNHYAYTGGDPINKIDPMGKFSINDLIGAIAGIATSISCDGATLGFGEYGCDFLAEQNSEGADNSTSPRIIHVNSEPVRSILMRALALYGIPIVVVAVLLWFALSRSRHQSDPPSFRRDATRALVVSATFVLAMLVLLVAGAAFSSVSVLLVGAAVPPLSLVVRRYMASR